MCCGVLRCVAAGGPLPPCGILIDVEVGARFDEDGGLDGTLDIAWS